MLKMIKDSQQLSKYKQHGVAAVEFSIIALILFTLLFGIFEFGRLFYVFNTVQEVTRHAAREAVVSQVNNTNTSPAKIKALFNQTIMPAGAEITVGNIDIKYLRTSDVSSEISSSRLPPNGADNITACLDTTGTFAYDCIGFVHVSITNATYAPMVSLFPFLRIPIPASTVVMPAESMGYSG
jgi:Flp pilus assembly protein TadG